MKDQLNIQTINSFVIENSEDGSNQAIRIYLTDDFDTSRLRDIHYEKTKLTSTRGNDNNEDLYIKTKISIEVLDSSSLEYYLKWKDGKNIGKLSLKYLTSRPSTTFVSNYTPFETITLSNVIELSLYDCAYAIYPKFILNIKDTWEEISNQIIEKIKPILTENEQISDVKIFVNSLTFVPSGSVIIQMIGTSTHSNRKIEEKTINFDKSVFKNIIINESNVQNPYEIAEFDTSFRNAVGISLQHTYKTKIYNLVGSDIVNITIGDKTYDITFNISISINYESTDTYVHSFEKYMNLNINFDKNICGSNNIFELINIDENTTKVIHYKPLKLPYKVNIQQSSEERFSSIYRDTYFDVKRTSQYVDTKDYELTLFNISQYSYLKVTEMTLDVGNLKKGNKYDEIFKISYYKDGKKMTTFTILVNVVIFYTQKNIIFNYI